MRVRGVERVRAGGQQRRPPILAEWPREGADLDAPACAPACYIALLVTHHHCSAGTHAASEGRQSGTPAEAQQRPTAPRPCVPTQPKLPLLHTAGMQAA